MSTEDNMKEDYVKRTFQRRELSDNCIPLVVFKDIRTDNTPTRTTSAVAPSVNNKLVKHLVEESSTNLNHSILFNFNTFHNHNLSSLSHLQLPQLLLHLVGTRGTLGVRVLLHVEKA